MIRNMWLKLAPEGEQGNGSADKPPQANAIFTPQDKSNGRPNMPQAKQPSDKQLAVTFDMDDVDLGLSGKKEEKKEVGKVETKVEASAEKPKLEDKAASKVDAEKLDMSVDDKKIEDTTKLSEEKPASLLDDVVEPPAKTDKRDYSGFSADETKVLKQMPNEAFNFASKLLKEKKELEQFKDGHYLKSPDAYQLDPAWKQMDSEYSSASAQKDFWREQLMLIKGGKQYKRLDGFNKDGSPIITLQPPSDEAEEDARMKVGQLTNTMENIKQNAGKFKDTYAQRIDADVGAIDAVRKQKFKWAADPKLEDEVINLGGKLGSKSIKQIKSDCASFFAAHHRANPLMPLVQDMFAGLLMYRAQLNDKSNEQVVEKIKEEEKEKVQTSSNRRGSGDDKGKKSRFGGPATFDLAGLPS